MVILATALLFLSGSWSSAQATDPPAGEEVILETVPGRQLFKEDMPCGTYFWKSEKADRNGTVMLYYFYGSPGWGKGKLGLYQRSRYRVIVDETKDPPTAQIVTDDKGNFLRVTIRMTSREREASRSCFVGE